MATELLVVTILPPFLLDDLAKDFTLHDYVNAADPDALVDDVGANIRGVVAGGVLGPDAALINRLPNLEIISSFSVGYDATDVVTAQQKGIIVTHTPDVLTEDVADLGMTYILMAPRRIAESERYLRAGKWLDKRMDVGVTVRNKKLGIIGLGRVGSAVAHRASAFGMDIGFYDIVPKNSVPYTSYGSLEELADESDFLLVSCFGGDSTYNLVNADILERLGPDGYLINIARGSIVDADAVVDALREKKIAGAALDVFKDEPNVPEGLLEFENVILTPHIASGTIETRRAMADLVAKNLRAHFAGEKVPTPVPSQL